MILSFVFTYGYLLNTYILPLFIDTFDLLYLYDYTSKHDRITIMKHQEEKVVLYIR